MNKEMASDQSPNPALNSALNYPVPLLVTLDEKVRIRNRNWKHL